MTEDIVSSQGVAIVHVLDQCAQGMSGSTSERVWKLLSIHGIKQTFDVRLGII